MASDNEASCESDPNFAVICAFLEKFGSTCGLPTIDFLELQEMLENTQEVPQELVDLHIKLLRKSRKAVSNERWEKAIIKFCHTFCVQDAWEIERFGYKKARISSKLRVLKELLELQFDFNVRFKADINKMSALELRSEPLGKDKHGHLYWYQFDNNCQIRIYKEDPDEETWTLVAKDRDGWVNLINDLSDGDSKLSSESTNNEEDSNSLVEKPLIDTGQGDSSSSDLTRDEKPDSDPVKKPLDISQIDEENPETEVEDENEQSSDEGEEEEEQEAGEESKKRLRESDSDDQNKKKPKQEVEVSEAIEEPLMLVKGEGTGAENTTPNDNPIVGETIEEDVVYFYGVGDGISCQTGNENKKSDKDTAPSANTQSVDKLEATKSSDLCTSTSDNSENSINTSSTFSDPSLVKNPYKLGTIIDTKTDNNKFLNSNEKSPTKKSSRWDVASMLASNNPPETKPTVGRVKELVHKWEQQQAEMPSSAVETPKKPLFFFGPGCLQFKRTTSPAQHTATVGFGQKVPENTNLNEKLLNHSDKSTNAGQEIILSKTKGDIGYRINQSEEENTVDENKEVGLDETNPVSTKIGSEVSPDNCVSTKKEDEMQKINKETKTVKVIQLEEIAKPSSSKVLTSLESEIIQENDEIDNIQPSQSVKIPEVTTALVSTVPKSTNIPDGGKIISPTVAENILQIKKDHEDAKEIGPELVPIVEEVCVKKSAYTLGPSDTVKLEQTKPKSEETQAVSEISTSEATDILTEDAKNQKSDLKIENKSEETVKSASKSEISNEKVIKIKEKVTETKGKEEVRNEDVTDRKLNKSTEEQNKEKQNSQIIIEPLDAEKIAEDSNRSERIESNKIKEETFIKHSKEIKEQEHFEKTKLSEPVVNTKNDENISEEIKSKPDDKSLQNEEVTKPIDEVCLEKEQKSEKSENIVQIETKTEIDNEIKPSISKQRPGEVQKVSTDEKDLSGTLKITEKTDEKKPEPHCKITEKKKRNAELIKDDKLEPKQTAIPIEVSPRKEPQMKEVLKPNKGFSMDRFLTTDEAQSASKTLPKAKIRTESETNELSVITKPDAFLTNTLGDKINVKNDPVALSIIVEKNKVPAINAAQSSSHKTEAEIIKINKQHEDVQDISKSSIASKITKEEPVEKREISHTEAGSTNFPKSEKETETKPKLEEQSAIKETAQSLTEDVPEKAISKDNLPESKEKLIIPQVMPVLKVEQAENLIIKDKSEPEKELIVTKVTSSVEKPDSSIKEKSQATQSPKSVNKPENLIIKEKSPSKLPQKGKNVVLAATVPENLIIKEKLLAEEPHSQEKSVLSVTQPKNLIIKEKLSADEHPRKEKLVLSATQPDNLIVQEKSSAVDLQKEENPKIKDVLSVTKSGNVIQEPSSAGELPKEAKPLLEQAENLTVEVKSPVKVEKLATNKLPPVLSVSQPENLITKENHPKPVPQTYEKSIIQHIPAVLTATEPQNLTMKEKSPTVEVQKLEKPVIHETPPILKVVQAENLIIKEKSLAAETKQDLPIIHKATSALKTEEQAENLTVKKNLSQLEKKPEVSPVLRIEKTEKIVEDKTITPKEEKSIIPESSSVALVEQAENLTKKENLPSVLPENLVVDEIPPVLTPENLTKPSGKLESSPPVLELVSQKPYNDDKPIPALPLKTGNLFGAQEDSPSNEDTVQQTKRVRSHISSKNEKEEIEGDATKKIKLSEEKSAEETEKISTFVPSPAGSVESFGMEAEPLQDNDSNGSTGVEHIENDSIAVSDGEKETKGEEKTAPTKMSLSTFSLDFTEAPSSTPSAQRALRKRGRESPLEDIEETTSGKRIKMKGKRSVDVKLRKSIEEQKKQDLISSDDDINKTEEQKNSETKAKSSLISSDDDANKTEEQKSCKTTPEVTPGAREKKSSKKKGKNKKSYDGNASTKPKKVTNPANKNKRLLTNLGINPDQPLDFDTGVVGVRQSRRIAQLKIKEEATRRRLEEETSHEIMLMQTKKKSKKSEDKDYKCEKKKPKPEEEEEYEDDSNDSKKRKKKKKKNRKLFDEHNPWRSSSDSSSNDDDEEVHEEEEEEDEELHLHYVSDHEFSPESDLEGDGEPQPLKRARTARKESADVEEEVDDCPCQKCNKSDHPEWILLCDRCDNGWHCSCLRPPLLVIPEGDWFCPPCQHERLLQKLQERLKDYDQLLSKKLIEDRRKERLAYVGISLNTVLPSNDSAKKRSIVSNTTFGVNKDNDDDDDDDDVGDEEDDESSSEGDTGTLTPSESDKDEPIYQLRQRRQAHSYRFNDYDDLIDSAIQDEMEAVKGAGNQGRGKDIATIVNAKEDGTEGEVQPEQQAQPEEAPEPLPPLLSKKPVEDEEEEQKPVYSDDEPVHKVKKKLIGRKKHRKLNSLDISSDDSGSDEDFKGTSSDSDEDFDDDLGSEDSEEFVGRGGRRRGHDPVRRSTRARTSRYDADFIDDGDSDEEEAPRRKKKRSIWDESESEESDRSWGRRKRKQTSRQKRTPAATASATLKKKKSKKKKKSNEDSDVEVYKKKKPKIKFGMDDDDEAVPGRRTRGKKINYVDALGSDSDEDRVKRAPPRIESEEEYVANEEEELDEDDKVSEEEEEDSGEQKQPKIHIQSFADARFTKPLPEGVPTPKNVYGNKKLGVGANLEQDGEEELNPIDQINKNLEEMDENEMEKMMEEEEYANKQLQLVALQIEKEKKRKEREAKKMELAAAAALTSPPQLPIAEELVGPKKRGRKPKNQFQFASEPIVGNVNSSMLNTENNDELSEPPGVSLPSFADYDNSEEEKKRRGRNKKSLEEAVATLGRQQDPSPFLTGLPPTKLAEIPGQESNIEIAAPPQPFSQSQPTPSVITRMLQNKPGQPGYPIGTIRPKQFATMSDREEEAIGGHLPPGPYLPPGAGLRPQLGSPYRQIPPLGMNHYPRGAPPPPHQIRNPIPQAMPPHIYHSHRPLDPSPSGGGTISISDHNSPGRVVSPASGSPVSIKNETPLPPYARPPVVTRFPMSAAAAAGPRHLHMVAPHLQPPRPSMSPYHPNLPPYHYGQFTSQPLAGGPDDAMPPTVYQNSPYSEQFPHEPGPGQVNPGDNSNSKSFDEESGGEFGGLVSYFSSQREDDLES